jgi:hypothetical protein
MYVVCVKLLSGHVAVAWKLLQKQYTFGNHSEATKKGKVFGILGQLKKLSKSNYVHAQNNVFNQL